ncbi:3-oxoacyl-[acyl-carrier-protein] reductase FabG [Rubripirellula obstinata]|uniref:3-oxoacyl-[acyl-carrier-protein] reductase FabG n=1 Tax=Rubripirellula obstinata TaxID=406547 RepID=A0A5B1CJX0_9BACT|nr:3-ketoacyl-ACP reductase [Rubripirellula obstinata]KAA1259614.1 3-oxoacyl-[acyl-carrier-protein] reductase FabG [Rubripirellula obstinata]
MTTSPVALITGGTRGIGLGIARSLANEGYDLAVCGVREASAVTETITELQSLTGSVLYCQCDVGSTGARKAMLESIDKEFGRLNLLVNNAGVAPRQRLDILDATEEDFDWVLKTNLQGPYFLTQAVANWLIDQQKLQPKFSGSIINVSSISATMASVGRGEYCVSKAGVSMATQLWAVRLAEFGLPVYEVRPGITATDMTSGVKEKYDKLIAEGLVPQKRWGTPEDTGRVVASLARGDMAYSTGQVIMVDGGLTLPRL